MMISNESVGDIYPYETKDADQIEKHLKDLFYNFNRSKLLTCEAMFDHYGSGYASYVDYFCYRKDGGSVLNEKYIEKDSLTSTEIEGLVIYVSRLAPVAIIWNDQRYKAKIDTETIKDEYFSGFTMLSDPRGVITEPPNDMKDEFREIKQKLEQAGYTILEKGYLEQPLPFKAKIETFTRPSQYKIFDAIFYWKD